MPGAKRIRISQNREPWLLLAPSLVRTALFALILFADAVMHSFHQAMGDRFVGLENFAQVWNSRTFRLAVRNILCSIPVCVLSLMAFSLWVAALVAAASKGGNVYRAMILLPLVIPVTSVVLLWKVLFYPQGLLNQLVVILGFGTRSWLNQNSAFYVLIFTYIQRNTGYDITLWLTGLDGVPLEFYEIARMNGAGSRQIFYYAALSCLRGITFLVTVLSIINSFKVFWEAYLISGDYPHESTYMMQHLFDNWFVSLDIQRTSIASVMIESSVLIPVVIWIRRRNEE